MKEEISMPGFDKILFLLDYFRVPFPFKQCCSFVIVLLKRGVKKIVKYTQELYTSNGAIWCAFCDKILFFPFFPFLFKTSVIMVT